MVNVIDTVVIQNLFALFRYKFNLNLSLFWSNYKHADFVHL